MVTALVLLAIAPGTITALVIAPLWTARWWVDYSRQSYTDVLREGTTRAEQVSIDYHREALWHHYYCRHIRPEVWQDPLVELSLWHWRIPHSGTVAGQIALSFAIGVLCGGVVLAASVCWHLRGLRSIRTDPLPARAMYGALASLASTLKPWFLLCAAISLITGAMLTVLVHFRESGPAMPPVQQVTFAVIGVSYALIPLSIRRCWRRVRQNLVPHEHAACDRCFYPRRGLNAGVCPECGARTSVDDPSPLSARALPWRSMLTLGFVAFICATSLQQSARYWIFMERQRAWWYGTVPSPGGANGMLWIPFDRTLCVELAEPDQEPERWYFRVASLGRLTHRITTFPDCSIVIAYPTEHANQAFMVAAAHLDTGGTLDHKFRWLYVRALVDLDNGRRGVTVCLRGTFEASCVMVLEDDADTTDEVAGMIRSINPESLPHGEDARFSNPVPLGMVVRPRDGPSTQ